MKKAFIYTLLATATAITLHSCRPAGVQTETHRLSKTYTLTDDSTRGILQLDIDAELPHRYRDMTVLETLRRDLIGQLFGEKYAACTDDELLTRFANDLYTDYRTENLPYLHTPDGEDIGFAFNNEFDLDLTAVPQHDGRIFSLIAGQYVYTGGAHGVSNTLCFNYDLTTGARLTEQDLFAEGYETPLATLLRNRILARAERPDDYWADDIAPNGNFLLTDEGLRYVFNPYEIAPYVVGSTEVTLSYEELKGLLKASASIGQSAEHRAENHK